MSGLTLAKYALALSGVVIVLAADRAGRQAWGLIGIALIVAAFLLRFRRQAP